MSRLRVLALVLAVFELTARPHAQLAAPRQLQGPEVIDALRFARTYTVDVGLPTEFTIEGERIFNGQVLAASTLTLAPGSRLVFAGSAGDRTDRYIVARTIRVVAPGGGRSGAGRSTSLPPTMPPTISWDRASLVMPPAAPVGKAPPGSIGGGEGADGGPGPDGQIGNPGYPGRSAPTLYVLVDQIEGGPIRVDLRGQDGGKGGPGQTGGDGGLGRGGRAGTQSGIQAFVNCRLAADAGGKGGKGGSGGRGGAGGPGGSGGTFVLLAAQTTLARFAIMFQVDVSPGQGGPGGEGGEPGSGGKGGPGGRVAPQCLPGSAGLDGAPGAKGPQGEGGMNGTDGVFATAPLTGEQVQTLRLQQSNKK